MSKPAHVPSRSIVVELLEMICFQLCERIDRIMSRRRKIERFIESVKDLPELITAFDESLWAGLVDSMTVNSKGRIVFRLTCGMEMEG